MKRKIYLKINILYRTPFLICWLCLNNYDDNFIVGRTK